MLEEVARPYPNVEVGAPSRERKRLRTPARSPTQYRIIQTIPKWKCHSLTLPCCDKLSVLPIRRPRQIETNIMKTTLSAALWIFVLTLHASAQMPGPNVNMVSGTKW